MNRPAMNRDAKRILDIYKYPGIAILLIVTPGTNMIYFHQHALLTPIPGMLLIYSLPLWVPYIVFRLLRVMRPWGNTISILGSRGPTLGLTKQRAFSRKYGAVSFLLFLLLMYPISFVAAASLNWGGIWGLHWKASVLYKLFTFPIGFALPPYGSANSEAMDMLFMLGTNLQ